MDVLHVTDGEVAVMHVDAWPGTDSALIRNQDVHDAPIGRLAAVQGQRGVVGEYCLWSGSPKGFEGSGEQICHASTMSGSMTPPPDRLTAPVDN